MSQQAKTQFNVLCPQEPGAGDSLAFVVLPKKASASFGGVVG